MTTGQMNRVLRQLRQIAAQQERSGTTDADLLDRFLVQREEVAFEALVHRHGPMVLGVCRRVLEDEHDADDAFQATFLVLLRRASSIRPGSCLGPWLHGVAHRTALKARTTAARRRWAEQQAGQQRPHLAYPAGTGSELRSLLDEEIKNLPVKYRSPLVLCLLQGKSRKEAAGLLGWSEGTLSGRLARAKEMLGQRLRRRGVVNAALVGGAAAAEVPAALVSATAQAAASIAAPTTMHLVATPVVTLTQEVVRTMLTSKLRAALGGLVVVAGIGLGTGAVAWQRGPAVQGAAPTVAGYQPTASKKEARKPAYVIEPPDILLVKYGAPEDTDPVKITGTPLVRPDGTIGLGPLGSVYVAGKTVEEAHATVAKHLKKYLTDFDARKLTVEVKTVNSKFFYVITKDSDGVEQVHRFPATPGTTVLDALIGVKEALIGVGKKRVCVKRPSRDGKGVTVLPVDCQAILQAGRTQTNYPLRPGDRVYIESAVAARAVVLSAGTDIKRLPPPSEKAVLRALPANWANREMVTITFERLDCRVDEPRFYPLVGPARLAHTHWKCTAYSDQRVEVLYLDVEYLIPTQ
jgi:RNA polymerase sigma factor (sigma-70 family)